MKVQQGFTMIELLVSMVLGLALIAGIGSMFLNFQQTGKSQRALSYMMEDGRYILETLSKELRSVGYLRHAIVVKGRTTLLDPTGAFFRNQNNTASISSADYCDSRTDVSCPVFLQDPNPACTTSCTGVLGSTGASKSSSGTAVNGINFETPDVVSTEGTTMEIIRGINGDQTQLDYRASDSFAVRYQLHDKTDLRENSSGTAGIELSNSPCTENIHLTTQADNGLVDEDPAAEAVVTPTSTTGAQVNVVTLYFYVANDAVKDANGNNVNIPTLYCRAKRENQFAGNSGATVNNAITTAIYNKMNPGVSTTPASLPLLSNIHRLVVRYGVLVDLNSPHTPSKTDDTFYYTDADTVNTDSVTTGTNLWEKVVAVKLYIVLRSEDNNLAQQAPSYKIDGVACSSSTFPCPTDKRFYRVFSTTIAFRN